jgi:poly-gamma-glutamate capsule biosynthesis protein CapA/YwtB (metallophosphatase superfamily)
MRICAVGDVAPRRADPASIFAFVAPALRSADLCFGQMECPISDRGSASPQARLAMRTSPDVAPVLRTAGFHVMSVAGNHVLDFGAEALADTLVHLNAADIEVCGGGASLAQARRPAMLECGGKQVAVLARSSILPQGYAANADRPGCAPMRAHTHYEQIEHDQPGTPPRVLTFADKDDLAALVADVRAARSQADVVLVSLHWGVHFVRATVADYQREVAFAVIEAGADAIIGHHPHLLKGVDFHCGKPIFYSLGNFAIEQPAAFDESIRSHESFRHLQTLSEGWQPQAKYHTPPETRHTALAWLDCNGDDLTVSLQPAWIDDDSVPQLLRPDDAQFAEWLDYLRAITSDAGLATDHAVNLDGLVTCCPAPRAG